MTHLPFIQQSCGDVLAETAHLSAEEFGAYQLLSFAFWQHGSLPEDDSRLARIVRMPADRWAEIKPTMQELFGIDWWPERLSKRRDDIEAAHLKKSAGGKAGAKKRWGGDDGADGIPNGSANGIPKGSPNGSANGNHNHNHNTPCHEGRAQTYTHARVQASVGAHEDGDGRRRENHMDHSPEDLITRRFESKAAAGAWLSAVGAFPGDPAFDRCLSRLLDGTATWADVNRAAT